MFDEQRPDALGELAHRFRAAMARRGLTPSLLEKAAGLSHVTVSHALTGTEVSSERTIGHLAAALKMDPLPLFRLREQAVRARAWPFMAPHSYREVVARPELSGAVLDILCRDTAQTVAMTTALHGAGGFGKTVLAAEICREPRMRERFPGGVLWADLEERTGAMLTVVINSLCAELGRPQRTLENPERAGQLLAAALAERPPSLLVVDDAWTATQLRPFLVGAPKCSRLVTTRHLFALPSATSSVERVTVGAMRRQESRELLTQGLPDVPDEALEPLLRRVADWPLLLTLVNGAIVSRVNGGDDPAAALVFVDEQLRASGPDRFDLPHAESRTEAVTTTMELSLDFLAAHRPDAVSRYLELAVFGEGPVPLPLVEALWARTGGVAPVETRFLCGLLADMSLLTEYRVGNPAQIRLHTMVRAYLTRKLPPDRREAVHTAYRQLSQERARKDHDELLLDDEFDEPTDESGEWR
ncbi:NB-ARC domain-containing protein [Streptomyces sp. NPDC005760]|uniref:NB-ARC domain-containing protein n=1 Tax=Streptomyces sp. NPDC005760 TaxID=3156718 RepID=UPI0033C7E228